jgi:hypothetical protein
MRMPKSSTYLVFEQKFVTFPQAGTVRMRPQRGGAMAGKDRPVGRVWDCPGAWRVRWPLVLA